MKVRRNILKITVLSDGKSYEREYSSERKIIDILRDIGINVKTECGGHGTCGKCRVTLINAKGVESVTACTSFVNTSSTIIYNTKSADFQYFNTKNTVKNTRLSVDIGTTVIKAVLFDKDTRLAVASISEENPQRVHSADVLGRIGFGNQKLLTNEITDCITRYAESSGCDDIYLIGNTAMLAIGAGSDVGRLKEYPFSMPDIPEVIREKVNILPSAFPFFGADAVAGLYICRKATDAPFLFADIGTNAEIALFDGEKFYCTSTAAGPCFEGCGIECGMTATDGAVYAYENGTAKVIGNTAPKGICGSGLLDIIAYLVNVGKIAENGLLAENYEISESVYITPKDVRNFQLAKSAIRSGIEFLLDISGKRGAVNRIFVAGSVTGKSSDSAYFTGLMPRFAKAETVSLSSLYPCDEVKDEMKRIIEKSKYYDLAERNEFSELFIKFMRFENGKAF